MRLSPSIKTILAAGMIALPMLAFNLHAQTGTDVWNPAGNPTQPSDGLWSDAANWTEGTAPGAGDVVVFNVNGAVPSVIDASAGGASCYRMNIGDGVGTSGSLIVTNGGAFNALSDYCAIGYSGNGSLDVENGGSATFAVHLWIGFNAGSTGTFTMNGGTVTVNQMTGLGWNGGTGTAHINGGTLNCAQFHPTQSIGTGCVMDISGGTVIINTTADVINTYIAGGKITAYAGAGTVNVDTTTNPGKVTLTGSGGGGGAASHIDSITVSGGNVNITADTQSGSTYHVEGTVSLPASWSTVAGTSTNASGTPTLFTFPAPANSTQFFRIGSP